MKPNIYIGDESLAEYWPKPEEVEAIVHAVVIVH
jgi:hypothetical protein